MTFHEQMFTAEGVLALCKEWFDSDVPFSFADLWSMEYQDHHKKKISFRKTNPDFCEKYEVRELPTTAADPCVWLKMRLMQYELLPVAARQLDPPPVVTAVFHVGFLTLEETPEMLARLAVDDEAAPIKLAVARSRVFMELQKRKIKPIDRVAAKVSPPKE